jgi:hypothetical protein
MSEPVAEDVESDRDTRVAEKPWWQAVEVWCLGAVLLAALVLESRDGETVQLRGWPLLKAPELCAARRWLGWQCPLCGATRSTLSLLHGQWRESLALHRLGWWCLAVIVGTAGVSLATRAGRFGNTSFSERFTYWCWTGTVLLLIANRAAELCGW